MPTIPVVATGAAAAVGAVAFVLVRPVSTCQHGMLTRPRRAHPDTRPKGDSGLRSSTHVSAGLLTRVTGRADRSGVSSVTTPLKGVGW